MNMTTVKDQATVKSVVAQCKAEGFNTRTIKTVEGYLVMFFK